MQSLFRFSTIFLILFWGLPAMAMSLNSSQYFQDSKIARFVDDIQLERESAVRRAIKEGIDVNAAGAGGARPLHFVARNKRTAVAETLLNAGANPNFPTPSGDYLLHYAVQQSTVDLTRVLLQHGANPNLPGASGKPVLFGALASPVAPQLLAMLKSAGVDLNGAWGGETPVTASMVRQDWASTVALLELGADADRVSPRGEAPADVLCDLLKRMRPGPPSGALIHRVGTMLGPQRLGETCQARLRAFQ
jgi:ankyrin repeat protein